MATPVGVLSLWGATWLIFAVPTGSPDLTSPGSQSRLSRRTTVMSVLLSLYEKCGLRGITGFPAGGFGKNGFSF